MLCLKPPSELTWVVEFLVKSSMLVWRNGFQGGVGCGFGGGCGGATYCGSACSSPARCGTLALQRRSRRFFGLLKPHVNFLLCRKSVVWFRPSMFQLSLAMVGIRWSCGWYVVMRNTFSVSFVCVVGVGLGANSVALSLLLARIAG